MNSSITPNEIHARIESQYAPLPEKPSGFKSSVIIIATIGAYVFLAIPVINTLGDIKGFLHLVALVITGGYSWTTWATYSAAKNAYQKEVGKGTL